jgi:hypothetical protein
MPSVGKTQPLYTSSPSRFKVRRLKRFCVVLLLVGICPLTHAQQANLVGSVTDAEGAAVSRARVYIHWDSSGSDTGLVTNVGVKQDVTTLTDREGRFSVTLPPGFYDLFVSAAAFSPDCRKIRIQPGRPASFATKLKADPIVTKEIGDSIRR